MRQRLADFCVGLFVLLAIVCLVVLAFKVSGLTSLSRSEGYTVTAVFNNIGGLKIRAPVTISGVRVGEVTAIKLDPATFNAVVTMQISSTQKAIPVESSASIFTEGLLGSNYINIDPGYGTPFLKNGSTIKRTHPALILEQLISQFLFNVKK